MDTIRAIQEKIINIIQESAGSIDKKQKLYHYTNCSALLNILKDNELWLSQREYMNDVYERSYANRILQDAFDMVYGINGEEAYCDFIDRMMPEVEKYYVFSLTTEHDLMSQWSYYGGNDGYCISFFAEEITSIFKGNSYRIQTGKIIYNKSVQLDIFCTILRYLKYLEENHSSIAQDTYLEDSLTASSLLILFHTLTKQENNHTENEYRIVISNPPNINFRNRKGIVIPYTKIKFDKSIPIKEIMVGPGINDKIAIDGLKQYIDSLKLDIDIQKSVMQVR